MSATHASHHDDRLLELLADRALDWLEPGDAQELERLVTFVEPTFDLDCLERAAAAVSVALSQPRPEPIPGHLRARLEEAAGAWSAHAGARGGGAEDRDGDFCAPVRRMTRGGRRAPSAFGVVGWLVAAAAIVFAVILWTSRLPGALPRAPLALAEQRRNLIDRAPDLVRIPWTATGDPAAGVVEGEIVWSDALDRGFMTFKGLAANDPSEQQYQLWIFDESRDERFPVDGGVFDIAVSDELTIIEIDPRLRVDHATLFAVTIERPGGVVVSSRQRLPVLAKPG